MVVFVAFLRLYVALIRLRYSFCVCLRRCFLFFFIADLICFIFLWCINNIVTFTVHL